MMRVSIFSVIALGALGLGGCTGHIGPMPTAPGNDGGTGGPPVPGPSPYEPVSPYVYVAKIKNLMTGLPATDAEVQAVVKDPTALKGLVDTWYQRPEFQARMLDFYRNAFQQNQVVIRPNLETNMGLDLRWINTAYQTRLARNLMDSFPLTVAELIKEGRPFNETITTNRYMMTTAMMSLLSYADDILVDDTMKTTDRLTARNAVPKFTIDPTTAIPIESTLNPADATNYMRWGFAGGATPTGCTGTPTAKTFMPATDTGKMEYADLLGAVFGWGLRDSYYGPCTPAGGGFNWTPPLADNAAPSINDWSDWRMVTIHPTDATNANTSPGFWDVVKMRAATDMYLHTPRQGFFGTLAYAANWGTNTSNEARVTANQSLIVGIGYSVNGQNSLVNFPRNVTDSAHASDPACNACHQVLDPYKQFFRQSFSLYYHDQPDTTQLKQQATFDFEGVQATGQGVGDVAKILANHPRFPLAWAQKLYFWASSTAADETDPELLRIADAFKNSNYDFHVLAREMFSSPLLTLATATQTTMNYGVSLSIARRDQYCTALANRLGLPDVCGMLAPKPTPQQAVVASRALLVANDTYYRAYELPSLPTNPDLFFRTSTESMCTLIANQIVDAGTGSKYSSANASAAITDFVATVMDIVPSDARSAPAAKILSDHFANAKSGGASATDALKSTFTLACIAPTSVIVGL